MELVRRPRIVCLGEGMVEERVGADGRPTNHYGGDTLNMAIHLVRKGCDVAYMTALGCDAQSDALLAAWQAEGLDGSLVLRHPYRKAGLYRIAVDADGERRFSYDRAESAAREMFALDAADEALHEAASADLLVFSLISLAILPQEGRCRLIDLASAVRASGGIVAFDGNYRPALWERDAAALNWQEQAISRSDIGLPTLEDETALSGEKDVQSVAQRWGRLGCGEVIVKSGAAGCLLPDGTMLAPPEALQPVDTSGAGDAFDAGYLAGRLRGDDPSVAAMEGHRLAGAIIMCPGAIPPREDVPVY